MTPREREVLEAGLAQVKGKTMPVQILCANQETLDEVRALMKGRRGLKNVTPVLCQDPNVRCFGAK